MQFATMFPLPRRLLSTALLAVAVTLQSLGAEGLHWKKLESVLENTPGEMFDFQVLLSVVEKQQTGVRTNSSLLVEMAVQSEYPFVAVAGLAGLSQINTELAYRVSLSHLWTTTNIGSPMVLPFLEYVTNRIALDAFVSAFSAVALFEFRDISSPVIVIQQIPLEHLTGWLLSTNRNSASMTVEALVIDRLIISRMQMAPDQEKSLQAKLKNLKVCPGVPTAIYLLNSDDLSLPLVPTVEAIADDMTVNTTLKQMVFRKYAKKLNGVLNVNRLKVPDKEKKRFKNWLLKYSQ